METTIKAKAAIPMASPRGDPPEQSSPDKQGRIQAMAPAAPARRAMTQKTRFQFCIMPRACMFFFFVISLDQVLRLEDAHGPGGAVVDAGHLPVVAAHVALDHDLAIFFLGVTPFSFEAVEDFSGPAFRAALFELDDQDVAVGAAAGAASAAVAEL